jgi:hypothetical protein
MGLRPYALVQPSGEVCGPTSRVVCGPMSLRALAQGTPEFRIVSSCVAASLRGAPAPVLVTYSTASHPTAFHRVERRCLPGAQTFETRSYIPRSLLAHFLRSAHERGRPVLPMHMFPTQAASNGLPSFISVVIPVGPLQRAVVSSWKGVFAWCANFRDAFPVRFWRISYAQRTSEVALRRRCECSRHKLPLMSYSNPFRYGRKYGRSVLVCVWRS